MKMKKSAFRQCLLIVLILFVFPALTHGDNIIKVALLPFQINSPENLDYVKRGIRDMLASRISVDRNVVVLEDALVNEVLSQIQQEPTTEAEIKQIGIQLGAAFIISGSLTKIGQSVSIDAKMFDLRESKSVTSLFTTIKGMDNVIPEISNFALKASTRIAGKAEFDESGPHPTGTPDSRISDAESELHTPDKEKGKSVQPDISSDSSVTGGLADTSSKFWKSQRFDFEIIGLDIGDVNGDGKNETIVMEHNGISIYRHSGNRLVLIQKIQGSRSDNYISLDVADINGNGIPEIFVTNLVERELQSFIIEFQNGDFRKIKKDIKYFLRVINTMKKGNMLLGQKIGIDGVFHGSVHQLLWKNNEYIEDERISLPSDSIIYGFNMADLDKNGEDEIILIDNNDYLKVFSDEGELIWKSDEIYGGTMNFITKYPDGSESNIFTEELESRLYMQNRVLVYNHSGEKGIVVIKNIPSAGKLFERVRAYGKSEVYRFVWDGLGLSENWKTQKIHGYIADFQIKDIDNDEVNELVVGIVQISLKSIFGSAKSYVLAYDLID